MDLRRLLIVIEPGRYGAFEYVAGKVDTLYRRHPNVTLDLAYSSRRSSEGLFKLVKQVREKGGEAVDLEVGNAPEWRDFRAAARLIGLVRRHRPQVIAAESSKAGALCRILRLIWPGFPPVLYMPHAYYGLGGDRSLKTLFFNAIEMVLGRFGHTVAVSADERRFALETLHLPPKRVALIHMNVDMRRFRPPDAAMHEAARAKLGLPLGARVLVAIGRDCYQKNYPPLYQALGPLLSDPTLNLYFIHAGKGGADLGRALPPAARARFQAIEYADPVEELLWAADAFIMTSRYEGLSLSVLSALACGLKVFLTRVPGNRCLARLGFSGIGWIEPTEEAPVLAERIDTLLREWLAGPDGTEEGEAPRARYWFDAEVQHEKIFRFLDHLATPP